MRRFGMMATLGLIGVNPVGLELTPIIALGWTPLGKKPHFVANCCLNQRVKFETSFSADTRPFFGRSYQRQVRGRPSRSFRGPRNRPRLSRHSKLRGAGRRESASGLAVDVKLRQEDF